MSFALPAIGASEMVPCAFLPNLFLRSIHVHDDTNHIPATENFPHTLLVCTDYNSVVILFIILFCN